MKKTLLTIVAALVATSSFGQSLSKNSAQVNNMQMHQMQMAPADLKEKIHKTNAIKRAAPTTLQELVGAYVWKYETAEALPENGTGEVTKTAYSENVVITIFDEENDSVAIYGMFNRPLHAKVDFEQGQLIIPYGFVAYNDRTYGDCGLIPLFYYAGDDQYEAGWYGDDLYLTIARNGSISFDDEMWLYLRILSGDYKGYRLGGFYAPSGTLERDVTKNGFMKTYSSSIPTIYGVAISQVENVVSVENFANHGATVQIIINDDNSITIEKQVTLENDTHGKYYTQAADFSKTDAEYYKDYVTGDIITGKATENELNWGNSFVDISEDGYTFGPCFAGYIYYIDGSKFIVTPTGINAAKSENVQNGISYNLSGQRVAEGYKGLVIKNGKKYVVK